MAFALFLASRYLVPKRTFVSVITLISVLGVALGVWLLTVVIAVYTGYGERIKDDIIGFEPHLLVDSGDILRNWPEFSERILAVEGVVAATPYARGQVAMEFQGWRSAPMVRGILPPEGEELARIRGRISMETEPGDPADRSSGLPRGDFDLTDDDSAVIGDGIADAQNIGVGDKVRLHSPGEIDVLMDSLQQADGSEVRKEGVEEIRERIAPREVTVKGIFQGGHIYVRLDLAQALFLVGPEDCHGIAVRTDDAFKANRFQESLHALLPEHFRILTWGQMHKAVLGMVAAERQVMFLILSMVVVVGGFCIMNTMITVTFQKRSEIGLVKALGAGEGQVAAVFLLHGALVGVVGVVAGLVLAQATLYFRNDIAAWLGGTFGVGFFTQDVFKIDGGLPAKQSVRDLAIISTVAFSACAIASIAPALVAAHLQPAKALRTR